MKEGEASSCARRACAAARRAVIVMAFDERAGRHLRPQDRDLPARLRAAAGRSVSAPKTSSSTRTSSPSPPASREHDNYAVDFIEGHRLDQGQPAPTPRLSGGVSNVSFSFRGNDPVREAIHTVFLYHAIKAGHAWASSMPAMLGVYDDLTQRPAPEGRGRGPQPPPGRRRGAGRVRPDREGRQGQGIPGRISRGAQPGRGALSHALVKGITDFVVADTEEVRARLEAAGQAAAGGHRRPADGRA